MRWVSIPVTIQKPICNLGKLLSFYNTKNYYVLEAVRLFQNSQSKINYATSRMNEHEPIGIQIRIEIVSSCRATRRPNSRLYLQT